MAKWYLRDRGHVSGPFTTAEVRDMRARGTIASFHEVSTDQLEWRAIDDVPALSGKAGGKGARELPPEQEEERPPGDPGRRATSPAYIIVIGVVVALILLGGFAVGAVVAFRALR